MKKSLGISSNSTATAAWSKGQTPTGEYTNTHTQTRTHTQKTNTHTHTQSFTLCSFTYKLPHTHKKAVNTNTHTHTPFQEPAPEPLPSHDLNSVLKAEYVPRTTLCQSNVQVCLGHYEVAATRSQYLSPDKEELIKLRSTCDGETCLISNSRVGHVLTTI